MGLLSDIFDFLFSFADGSYIEDAKDWEIYNKRRNNRHIKEHKSQLHAHLFQQSRLSRL